MAEQATGAGPSGDDEMVSEKAMADATAMLAVFDKQNDDGSYAYTDEEVRDFLPMLLLGAGNVQAEQLTEEVADLLGEFAKKAGLTPGESAEAVSAKVAGYYADHPPNAALVASFEKFLQAFAADGGSAALSSAVAAALGQQVSNRPVGGDAPDGSVKGGVLGRLQAGAALDKKKR